MLLKSFLFAIIGISSIELNWKKRWNLTVFNQHLKICKCEIFKFFLNADVLLKCMCCKALKMILYQSNILVENDLQVKSLSIHSLFCMHNLFEHVFRKCEILYKLQRARSIFLFSAWKTGAYTSPHQRPFLLVETPSAKGCKYLFFQTLTSPPWPSLNWQPVWWGFPRVIVCRAPDSHETGMTEPGCACD